MPRVNNIQYEEVSLDNPSMLERRIEYLLQTVDLLYVKELSFLDLKSPAGNLLRFDFAVFESSEDLQEGRVKFVVECQGEQHYKKKFQDAATFARQQSNDKRKKAYCQAKGIPLVDIPYLDFNYVTIEEILERGKFFD